MRQLLIIENEFQLKQAMVLAVHNPTVHFAAASAKLGKAIKERGYVCLQDFPEDVFANKSEVDAFESEVWALARNWYKAEPFKKVLDTPELSLGGAVELYMGNALIWALRNWLWMKRICAAEKPDEIICFGDAPGTAHQFFPMKGEVFAAKLGRHLGHNVRVASRKREIGSFDAKEAVKSLARQFARFGYQKLKRRKPLAGRQKILIVSALHHVRSLIVELKKNVELIYLDESFRASKVDFIQRNKMAYYSYPEIQTRLDAAAKKRLAGLKRSLLQLDAQIESLTRSSKAFYFQGEDVSALIMDRLHFFLKKGALQAATYFEVFQAFVAEQGVNAVVVDEDTVTFRKCLVWASAAKNIPTFQVPHGVSLSDFHYDLFPVSSDRALVAASGIKKFYTEHGVREESLDLVGIPRYDDLRDSFSSENRSLVRKRYGFGNEVKVVLFAPTVSLDVSIRLKSTEAEKVLQEFAKAMREIQAKLIVKFHPLDVDSEEKKALFLRLGLTDAIFIKDGDAASLAAASDLVVSFASNLAIECLAFEKPVLWLDVFSLSEAHVPYLYEPGCDFKVNWGADWKARIRAALFHPDPEQLKRHAQWFKECWVGPLDGQSGLRAARAILCAV